MIPRLNFKTATQPLPLQFLELISKHSNFQGEVHCDYASRLLDSTDNSVYQVVPQAVVFPKTQRDIEIILKLAHDDKRFHTLSFAPRGGGTGTNGQSLSAGIIIDCSKYMTNILEVNLDEEWILVEPGVVLDQLNAYLKPMGVFFAPTLSPSSRATLGGMASTDACGKGSRLYGKTSQHILELSAVYTDGSCHTSMAIDRDELEKRKALPGRVGEAYRQVDKTVCEHRQLIQETFPKLQRFMTGYNLAHVYSPSGEHFNLNAILTGSEGTLAIITALKLKLTPIPKFKCLVVTHYASFSDALKDGAVLLQANPAAIETIDETILNLARTDIIYEQVKSFIGDEVAAINLTEFVANDEDELKQHVEKLRELLDNAKINIASHVLFSEADMNQLWALRKKSVGLLANVKGRRKPISGMEDTVVPPERLPEYVAAFRALLESHGLTYGLFGHIDAGCLHVRPAMDLSNPEDEALFLELSEKVAQLTRHYGGLMWGEHGKGYRSCYMPLFFGTELDAELQKIKASFDPYNQLNPGKIATPDTNSERVSLAGPMRGHFDRQVTATLREANETVFSCNGNGACFNVDEADYMCPSYKVTKDRRHSPKGRASLMREWLRQLSQKKSSKRIPFAKLWNSFGKRLGRYDYSHEVYRSMEGCLACKACATECPVHINVPSFRSVFLEKYHGRYCRSLRDHLIANAESLTRYQQRFPKFVNALFRFPMNRFLLKKIAGLVDTPMLHVPNMMRCFAKHDIQYADVAVLSQLNADEKKKTIVIVQDWVTSFYETDLVIQFYRFLSRLGYHVFVMPWFPNGKPLHVNGFLKRFRTIAEKNVKTLQAIADLNISMVGVDPSMLLTFRYEYPEILGENAVRFKVHLIQEWLMEQLSNGDAKFPALSSCNTVYKLLSHCTEKTAQSQTDVFWQSIFEAFGLTLVPVNTGCCGMAGTYGHERNHQVESRRLFRMSWEAHIPKSEENDDIVVTGYSCRSQIRRLTAFHPKHPVEVLLGLM